MKALVILILLVCAVVAVWYFRDDITGMRLRFVERESGGARFRAPNWRVSTDDTSGAESHLILKHKRLDKRIFALTGQYADERLTPVEREALLLVNVAAVNEMVGAQGKATWSDEAVTIAGQNARRATITFDDPGISPGVGPGVFVVWDDPTKKWRWAFVLVDDDEKERDRILREFVASFTRAPARTPTATASAKQLVFDAPAGWKRVEQTPARTTYVSPDEDAQLELHAATRTSRSTMTKDYAQSQAATMIEAAGATWQPRSIDLERDARLNTTVAVVRGTARMGSDQRAYEIRLWIAPNTPYLYVAALSALDEKTLDACVSVFERVRTQGS